MLTEYVLAASVSSGVSSVVIGSSLLGYKIIKGWKRYKAMYLPNNLTRRMSMTRDFARYLEECGYNELARKRSEIVDMYESLHAKRQEKWNALSLRHKLRQAIASGFS